MSQPLRLSSAASLIVLGSMIGGCATQHDKVGAATQLNGKPAELGYATRALAAFSANNIPAATDFAEKAVAQKPSDAGIRTLLGNAYFAGGRFLSAEGAYRDSLTLNANQPQIILKLALVQIAQGKNVQAVGLLKDARSVLEPSDYGLAMALAGHTGEAIAVLDPAARQRDADATVRQNLALAHALAGDWEQARVIAAQDVAASQLDARIQQWMQLAKPKTASDQVAALVGVTPALTDAGQPVQLALNKADRPQPFTAPSAPVQVAQSAPAPFTSDAKPAFVAAAQPVAPVPAPVAAVAPAPPPARPTIATLAASAVTQAKAVLASVMPHHATAAPAKPRVVVASQPVGRSGKSQAVVQLGAYGSPERVLAAWNGAAHKYGALKNYAPMSARFASPKGTFYRLSVRGFNNVAEAASLCNSLRRAGGACFVRNVAGDAPVNIAMR
ncbi:MAG TPA: SPOR domain-containing protein [Sphingomicrobium sp.]